jgi:hypothetical protein
MAQKINPEEYYKKLAEHANKLALQKPDLNLSAELPSL